MIVSSRAELFKRRIVKMAWSLAEINPYRKGLTFSLPHGIEGCRNPLSTI